MSKKALIAFSAIALILGCEEVNEPSNPSGQKEGVNTFRIETSGITPGSVVVTVTPSLKQDIYVFGVMTKAQAEAAKYDDEIVGSVTDGVQNITDVAVKGDQEKTFTGLQGGTPYIAFAAGVNSEGKRTTDVQKAEFTTLPGEGGQEEQGPGQGIYSETFDGYTGGVKSNYSAMESFTSTSTGVTWTLLCGCIDQTEDQAAFSGGHCFTLGGKAGSQDEGQSVLTTSTLKDGITRLAFDYVANKTKKLEVQVLVGSTVVWSSGELSLTNNGQSDPKNPVHLSFNITGAPADAVLKFVNVSSARRISIGNITWTNATGQGGNGSSFEGGEGGEGGSEDGTTTLNGDFTMSATNVLAEYYGDYYETGTNDWVLTMENSNGDCLMIELITAKDATTPVGTFTIDQTDSFAQGTALYGYIDEDGYIYPTSYFNENTLDYALIYGGSVTVSGSGSSYTVSASFTDALNHKVSCNYTGAITIQEGQLIDDGEGGEGGEGGSENTTLTSDVTVSGITYAGASYYGNDLDTGTNDWIFYMGNDNEELCFELFTALGTTTPVGTFSIDLDYSGAVGTAWDGCDLGFGLSPAYYNYISDDYAYPSSGTITISGSGSGYTVVVNVVDELGNKISCNYTGALEIEEGQFEEAVAAAAPLRKTCGKACRANVKTQSRKAQTPRDFRIFARQRKHSVCIGQKLVEN